MYIKKILILLILLLACGFLNSQAQSSSADSLKEEREIFTIVEEMPVFPGGEEALFKYLANNIQYPYYEKSNGISGTVYVAFVIEPDGSTSNIVMLRELPAAPGFTKEALRLVSEMPKWEPGRQRGKPVPVMFNLPLKWTTKNFKNEDWHFFMKQGSFRLDQGQFKGAIEKFNKALKLAPNQPEILFERAAAKLNSGDKIGACADWNTILEHTKIQSFIIEATTFITEYCKE